ncbi:hypothetical protein NAP1_05445 [Erythrobacter sp. NAP1]|uniref:hypothetical protein n=1 Tax=Erythrobacter sp. NAP1 TaxID=237727 RepID=UPI0000686A8F|nr:hypothetical protein [Erythrobacter sp. NAP1]EAQ30195.1 hypothetical protein NAP1_05445 [Erythrobacter sp. NAP1]
MNLALIGKAVIIALCAAVAAWGYVALLGFVHTMTTGEQQFSTEAALTTLGFSLLGSFAIGLPTALLTYFLSSRHLIYSPTTVMITGLLSGVMLVLASFVLGGEAGIVMLGVPALIAAITFAVLGWYWILKPKREAIINEAAHG